VLLYKIEIDYSPAYELITSLYTYLDSSNRQISELGTKWVKQVEKSINADFANELKDQKLEVLHRLSLLVWQCPHKETITGFLYWLEQLPSEKVYELLVPWVQQISKDMIQIQTYFVSLLRRWNEQYFCHLSEDILEMLQKDALKKTVLASQIDPVDLVEQCTNGMHIMAENVDTLLLVPQFHQSPFSVIDYFDGLITCLYPVDQELKGEPPKKLERQMKSLADERRLKILRYLQEKPRTFSEIQQFTGLAKGNVHYHIKLLRTAGFIRAHHNSKRVEKYSLRDESLVQLQDVLFRYVKGD
jgi:DNA-binding transcriptional ArsR family regulator